LTTGALNKTDRLVGQVAVGGASAAVQSNQATGGWKGGRKGERNSIECGNEKTVEKKEKKTGPGTVNRTRPLTMQT